jgi:hypothetical protein
MVTPSEVAAVYLANGWQFANEGNLSAMEMRMVGTFGDGSARWELGRCRVCNISMGIHLDAEHPATVCDRCEPMVVAHYAGSQAVVSPSPRWDAECPALYKDIIQGRIQPPTADVARINAIAKWRPERGGKSGLVITGDTGVGKTIAVWSLALQLDMLPCNWSVWSAVEIARELAKHAKNLEAAIHLWKIKVLMIDDLGKERITPAASSLLWELIDRRYSAQVPTIITTRFRGQEFADRFAEPTLGADIRRRINDTCKVVSLAHIEPPNQ